MYPHFILDSLQLRKSKLWHLIAGMVLGAAAALSILFPSAAALEQARDKGRVHALYVDLGRFLCKDEGGLTFVTPVGNDRYRFDCVSGTAIEERVILR